MSAQIHVTCDSVLIMYISIDVYISLDTYFHGALDARIVIIYMFIKL